MVVACTTNGVNIRYFESLLTRYSANFGAMQITLDGPQKIHDSRRHRLGGQGTFREIVDGIEILAGLKVRVHIRVNLDADNIDFLPQLCEFIDGRGWSRSPHIDLAVAAVSSHTESGCKFRQTSMMSELDIHKRLLTLMREYPVVARLCRPGHLTHLAHLASVLDPLDEAARRNRPTGESGPRYWYCEQGTGKQWVFTPDGHIYTCPEAVGQPSHAIGRFDPVLNLWREPAETWLGKTILSEPKCKECQISTLCGGGCQLAVHERVRSARLAQVDASASSRIPLPMSSSAPFSVYADSAVQANEKDQFCVGVEEIVREYLTQVGQRFVELGVIPS
jgi:uncharacterized protein